MNLSNKVKVLSNSGTVVAGLSVLLVGMIATGNYQTNTQPPSQWKVGFAQTVITPAQPVLMAGYAGRTKPFEKVAGELYVKAMVLEDFDGHRGVLVTSDLLGFPAEVTEPICERLQKQAGLKREQILFNSSHTHAGPLLSLKPLAKDAPGAGEAFRTVEYTRQLQDKVVNVVAEALQLACSLLACPGVVE